MKHYQFTGSSSRSSAEVDPEDEETVDIRCTQQLIIYEKRVEITVKRRMDETEGAASSVNPRKVLKVTEASSPGSSQPNVTYTAPCTVYNYNFSNCSVTITGNGGCITTAPSSSQPAETKTVVGHSAFDQSSSVAQSSVTPPIGRISPLRPVESGVSQRTPRVTDGGDNLEGHRPSSALSDVSTD